jgi:hypothetical protein
LIGIGLRQPFDGPRARSIQVPIANTAGV